MRQRDAGAVWLHEKLAFVHGMVRSHDFGRKRAVTPDLSQRYSFGDALEVVGGVTRSYASFSESECSDLRTQLVALDPRGTGRVPLAKFYDASGNGVFDFGESEAYLRQLGALETSGWGKQVLIANYLQAASNCIVSTPFYRVCCSNPCEGILGEIEVAVSAPAAEPGLILPVVRNITPPAAHDGAPVVDSALAEQLTQIAERYGGQVPLHSRLFAQWLHHVYPQDCPFPHRAVTSAPEENVAIEATWEEKQRHILASVESYFGNASDNASSYHGFDGWISQWSPEEELLVEYPLTRRTPGPTLAVGILLLSFGAIFITGRPEPAGPNDFYKSHMV